MLFLLYLYLEVIVQIPSERDPKSLGHCITSHFLEELCKNLALNYSFFALTFFPPFFIQENMAATDNDNDTEQNIPMDPANLEAEGNYISPKVFYRF